MSHILTPVQCAPGAGYGRCSCGWRSKVSDDGAMYEPGYYSPADIKSDWQSHVRWEAVVEVSR